jgi:hypothetical protein
MESTPKNLPDRLRWFHENGKTNPAVLIAAPLIEAAEAIEWLRRERDMLAKRLEEPQPPF